MIGGLGRYDTGNLVINGIHGRLDDTINRAVNLYCHVTEDTLISEMSKFGTEESEEGFGRRTGVKVV